VSGRARAIRAAVGGFPPVTAACQGVRNARTLAGRWAIGLRARGVDAAPRRGRILAYHSIGTPHWGINDVSPRNFERHLQIAVDDGWGFATPAQVLADPDQPLLALTFDDGVASVLNNALPVLRHHGIPATAFVVTGWADGQPFPGQRHVLDWSGIRALHEAGVTIASHSVSHRDFGRLGAAQMARELNESRSRLLEMTGVDSDEFALPFGQSANWSAAAQQAALDAGYRTLYAQSVNTRPAGTVARTFITRTDRPVLFRAALAGAFDNWEE
jgi:peptidoglycan/xylan/chitin deacetylase (PgdA/CDA1 family)